MTDAGAQQPPFPGFPGFPPAEMLDKMWDMMRLTPFGSAFPGMQPGAAQGIPSPFSAMSDMMTPLMSVEELDKRITDMRAVEQWLKLNLNMLQSAIQALEVQRATLSTLRAFGAFAQASMSQPPQDEPSAKESAGRASGWGAKPAPEASAAAPGGTSDAEPEAGAPGAPGAGGAFDPTGWWNLLQTQFNQLASFAMAQPAGEAAAAGTAEGGSGGDSPGADTPGEGRGAKPAGASRGGEDGKPTARMGEARTKAGAPKAAGGAARSPSAKPAAKRGSAGSGAATRASGGASPPHDE